MEEHVLYIQKQNKKIKLPVVSIPSTTRRLSVSVHALQPLNGADGDPSKDTSP